MLCRVACIRVESKIKMSRINASSDGNGNGNGGQTVVQQMDPRMEFERQMQMHCADIVRDMITALSPLTRGDHGGRHVPTGLQLD